MKYKVTVEEVISQTFEIEAGSETEALRTTAKNYHNGTLIVDSYELLGTTASVMYEDGTWSVPEAIK